MLKKPAATSKNEVVLCPLHRSSIIGQQTISVSSETKQQISATDLIVQRPSQERFGDAKSSIKRLSLPACY